MDGKARLQLNLYGQVQGVGFRWFARQQAQLLGCTGFVRNAPGGASVEVVAEGPRTVLAELAARLQRGPTSASVTRTEMEWHENTGEFELFEIRP